MLPIAMAFSTRRKNEQAREMVLDGTGRWSGIFVQEHKAGDRLYAGVCALFHIGLKVELELWSLHQFFSVSNFGGTEFLCKN
jgi:hypothetical protein